MTKLVTQNAPPDNSLTRALKQIEVGDEHKEPTAAEHDEARACVACLSSQELHGATDPASEDVREAHHLICGEMRFRLWDLTVRETHQLELSQEMVQETTADTQQCLRGCTWAFLSDIDDTEVTKVLESLLTSHEAAEDDAELQIPFATVYQLVDYHTARLYAETDAMFVITRSVLDSSIHCISAQVAEAYQDPETSSLVCPFAGRPYAHSSPTILFGIGQSEDTLTPKLFNIVLLLLTDGGSVWF
ncbi:hypothetical protein LXA43DRAFT_1103487 [Ganoderma leucocontextum]|nr:hypothetical protein LXA43DRAFT_1103487 [Ganoderma leucocontextum]